jgi:NitT/TauT family transport system permease protein
MPLSALGGRGTMLLTVPAWQGDPSTMTGERLVPAALLIAAAGLLVVLAMVCLTLLTQAPAVKSVVLIAAAGVWALAWFINTRLVKLAIASPALSRLRDLAVPALFGLTLLFLWEVVVKTFGVPLVLLPAPSDIGAKLITSLPTLGADFVQTFLRAVIPGWVTGSAAGFAIAILCDRVPFLARGLLPLGNFVAALPIVGVAPIMVMWFGFDWQSKVAVVVIMTFFPMLVNAIAGLQASGHLERDLMRSYGSGYWQTLFKLRLPAAMPFIFNALKINSTLALIGAIVAEFFGTPIVGMGFRISTEVGRLALDMVWAEIAIAALVGSAFYGAIVLAERWVTFWHPSLRR